MKTYQIQDVTVRFNTIAAVSVLEGRNRKHAQETLLFSLTTLHTINPSTLEGVRQISAGLKPF